MEISGITSEVTIAMPNPGYATRTAQHVTRNPKLATRNTTLRRSFLCLIGNQKLWLFCATGAAMAPPILPASGGWNTRPIFG